MAVAFTGTGGNAGLWAYNQGLKNRQANANAGELEELQLELLRAEVANIKSQGQGDAELSRQSGEMAKDYLNQWNEGLKKTGKMYNTAIDKIGTAEGMVGKAYKDVSTSLGEMSGDIKSEWETMKSDYQGIKGDLIGSAKEGLTQRGELRRQFMGLTRMDEEGAAGRAMADVSAQSEAGRKSEAMRLAGLGIDPASGRARSLMRTSRSDEALGKAMAANKARLMEKDRVAGLTAKGMELIDPTQDVNTAAAIQSMQNNLLSTRSNLEVSRANVQGNLASTTANLAGQRGQLATGFAQNVVAPKGEWGATQMGISQGSRGTAPAATVGGGGRRAQTFATAQARGASWRKKYYG